MRYIVKFVVKFVKSSNIKKKKKEKTDYQLPGVTIAFLGGGGGDRGHNLHNQVHEHMVTVCTSCIYIHTSCLHACIVTCKFIHAGMPTCKPTCPKVRLKVPKHEIFYGGFFAAKEPIWSPDS